MTFSIHTFELRIEVDSKEYRRLLKGAFKNSKGRHRITRTGYGNEDQAFSREGITIEYHDYNPLRKNFKRTIKFIVNPSKLLGGDDLELWTPARKNINRLIAMLKDRIKGYFLSKYKLRNFDLTRVDFTVNIDVGSRDNVTHYIKILNKLGRVKGYSLKYDKSDDNDWYDRDLSFDLEGNSAGVEFTAYDKEAALRKKSKEDDSRRRRAKGILRIEVRLMKRRAISNYTNKVYADEQIEDLARKSEAIFMECFAQIVPFGDFYKKKEAVEIIERCVPKKKVREKMIRLIELIPEKKSLYLAQKEMQDRNIKGIMKQFADLNLSPVTISKRQKVKHLKNLYSYFV